MLDTISVVLKNTGAFQLREFCFKIFQVPGAKGMAPLHPNSQDF